jgi:hypothetical protein
MASTELKRKQGDSLALSVRLRDARGYVDLSGATVKFRLRAMDGGALVADAAASLGDQSGTPGAVSYAGGTGLMATPGTYYAEWHVTWPDATEDTFPSDSYDHIVVLPKLG